MVICFECPRETKGQLDELVANGTFASISEAISVAVSNQVLLGKSVASSELVIAANQHPTGEPPRLGGGAPQDPTPWIGRIPAIFLAIREAPGGPVAALPKRPTNYEKGKVISQGQWIFGQHNKLLPVKATSRALATLLAQAPTGAVVEETSRSIANHAAELGGYLQGIDRKFDRTRDDMLSTAFPGRLDPDKGRIRYANQFVAGVTKQGVITGLLVDLGLLNALGSNGAKIALTEAGWKFALMPNPVLDNQGENPSAKFSREERSFLAAHIASSVPVERSAYLQILGAIHDGNDNPEKLRVAFNRVEKETAKNKLFFATQRAGALSRMADLGFLRRDRDGIRVKYAITEEGAAFLNQ